MNTTIDVVELQTFSAVVTCGSFTAAAEVLGTDKAHVSRIISRLENKLSARLLERSTRRLRVTEIGREVYERAAGILLALEETANSVARSQAAPSGTLRLTAGPEFGVAVVNRWVAKYLKTYADVRVEAEYANRVTDVIHEGFDLAIRVGALADSELSARKLGEIQYRFYASPRYLEHHPPPADPQALASHALIAFSPRGQPMWRVIKQTEKMDIKPDARFLVSNNQAALGMTVEGLGIALLPSFLAEPALAEEKLAVVLPEWTRIPVPIHAVFPSTRYMAPKVRAFIDLAIAMF